MNTLEIDILGLLNKCHKRLIHIFVGQFHQTLQHLQLTTSICSVDEISYVSNGLLFICFN